MSIVLASALNLLFAKPKLSSQPRPNFGEYQLVDVEDSDMQYYRNFILNDKVPQVASKGFTYAFKFKETCVWMRLGTVVADEISHQIVHMSNSLSFTESPFTREFTLFLPDSIHCVVLNLINYFDLETGCERKLQERFKFRVLTDANLITWIKTKGYPVQKGLLELGKIILEENDAAREMNLKEFISEYVDPVKLTVIEEKKQEIKDEVKAELANKAEDYTIDPQSNDFEESFISESVGLNVEPVPHLVPSADMTFLGVVKIGEPHHYNSADQNTRCILAALGYRAGTEWMDLKRALVLYPYRRPTSQEMERLKEPWPHEGCRKDIFDLIRVILSEGGVPWKGKFIGTSIVVCPSGSKIKLWFVIDVQLVYRIPFNIQYECKCSKGVARRYCIDDI